MAFVDILSRLATDYADRRTYGSIILTCKQLHWAQVDSTSPAGILRTYGHWRLPGRDFGATNRVGKDRKQEWYECTGAGPHFIDYGVNEISFYLACSESVITSFKHMYTDDYVIKIDIGGSEECCGGDARKCPYGAALVAWIKRQDDLVI
jgi:hypothetical protein